MAEKNSSILEKYKETQPKPMWVLSDQALGAIMIILQKGIMEQGDVTELLRSLNFVYGPNQKLYVTNPPILEFANDVKE